MPTVMMSVEPERKVHRVLGGENLLEERSVYPIQTLQKLKPQRKNHTVVNGNTCGAL